jgi:hypothetical protein
LATKADEKGIEKDEYQVKHDWSRLTARVRKSKNPNGDEVFGRHSIRNKQSTQNHSKQREGSKIRAKHAFEKALAICFQNCLGLFKAVLMTGLGFWGYRLHGVCFASELKKCQLRTNEASVNGSRASLAFGFVAARSMDGARRCFQPPKRPGYGS